MNSDEIYNDNLNEDDGESIGDDALNTNLNRQETADFHKSFLEQQKRLIEEMGVLIKEISVRFEKERSVYKKVTQANEIFKTSNKKYEEVVQKINSFLKEDNDYTMPIELLNKEQELKERMERALKLIDTFTNQDESINREMELIFMKIDEIQGLFVKNNNVLDQGDISKN